MTFGDLVEIPRMPLTPRLAWLYAARPVEYYRALAACGTTVRTWTPFGRGIVTGDPAVVEAVFARASLGPMTGLRLENFFGASSPVVLGGEAHAEVRRQIRRPMRDLEGIEEIAAAETARTIATWPRGRPFALLPSLKRLSLRVILRALAGEGGLALEASATRWAETITAPIAGLPALRIQLAGLGPWDRHQRARGRPVGEVEEST